MTDPTPSTPGRSGPVPMPVPIDPFLWVRAQQRWLGMYAGSARILARAAQECAERHAALGRALWSELVSSIPTTARACLDGEARSGALERMERWVGEVGGELAAMQRVLSEAQVAILEELRRAVVSAPPAEESGPPAPSPIAEVEAATALAASEAPAGAEASEVVPVAPEGAEPSAAAVEPVERAGSTPEPAAGEPGRSRRSRRAAAPG